MSLRVLLVTVGLERGGAERAVIDLADALRARGDRPFIVAVRRGGALTRRAASLGLSTLFPGAGAHAHRALDAFVDDGGPLVVHSHLFAADAIACAWAARLRVPAVTTWHNTWEGYEFTPLRAHAARALYPRFDERIAVAAEVAASFSTHVATRSVVTIPNVGAAVDDEARRRGAELRRSLPPGHRLLVCAGRLVETKRFDLLVGAVARLPDDVHLWIAGDGPLAGPLAARARNIGARVRLLGPRDDVPSLFCAADVVVIPSRVEGLPLVGLEALGAGTPVVATAVGGLKSLLDGSPLPLVDADADETTLAAALTAALARPALAAAFRAFAAARLQRHAPEVVFSAIRDVYNRVLDEAV